MTGAPSPDARSERLVDALVVLAAALTFAVGVPAEFLTSWDDGRFIVDNADVHAITGETLLSIWTEPHFQAWHPLHLMSYWLDVPWGADATTVHAVNLALWALGLLLLRRVFTGLGLPLVAATVAVLVFGLHPVQVEAVTWATGRKESVALIFAAASFLLHLRSQAPFDRASWGSRALFVAAAMTKTSVLPLPLVFVLADVLLRNKPWKLAAKAQLLSLVVAAGFAANVVDIWSAPQQAMVRGDVSGPGIILATVTHHLGTALMPISTSPLYPIDRDGGFEAVSLLGPVALGLGLTLAAFRRAPRLGFALGAFLLLLLPVMNFVPVYFQFQDRYLSLPLLGLAFGVGAMVAATEGKPRRKLALAASAALLVGLAGQTASYARVWTSDGALWWHATHTQPESFYAWKQLGDYRRDRRDFRGAISAYERAIEVAPGLRLGHSGLFLVQLLRDEQRLGLTPSRAMDLARRYHQGMEDEDRLRMIAGDMVVAGYRDAALVPLARSFELAPVTADRLESAAIVQLDEGNEWLARFYVGQMQRQPVQARLRDLVDAPTPERPRQIRLTP